MERFCHASGCGYGRVSLWDGMGLCGVLEKEKKKKHGDGVGEILGIEEHVLGW